MPGKNIFTTSAPIGVLMRDIALALGSVLTVLGVLGLLSDEQVRDLTEQAPVLFTALGAVIAAAVSIYRTVTKSSSDKAAEVAKQVDEKLPASETVVIRTPGKQADIVVPPKP